MLGYRHDITVYNNTKLEVGMNELVFFLGGGTQEWATRVETKFSVFGSGAHVKSRPWQKYVGELFLRVCDK
jgi:hypothetical protein